MLFVRSDFKLRSFESHLFLSLAAGDVALLCSRFQRTDSTMMIVPSQKVSENNRMFLGDRANIAAVPVVHPTKQHSITRRHSNVLLVVTLLLLFLEPTSPLLFIRRIRNSMGQAISTSQWYFYGKRHFTKTGYLRHIKDYTDPVQSSNLIRVGQKGEDGVNLGGKVVVVTGYVL